MGTALQVVLLLLLLSILAGVLLMLFAVLSLVNAPGQLAGGVSTGLGGAASEAGRAVRKVKLAPRVQK